MKRQWVSSVVTNESSWRWIWPASESQSARSRFVPSYEEAEVGPSWSCDHRWPLSSHLAPGHTFNNHTTEGNELLIHSEPAVPVTSAESVMWNIGVDWSGPRLSINQSINQVVFEASESLTVTHSDWNIPLTWNWCHQETPYFLCYQTDLRVKIKMS